MESAAIPRLEYKTFLEPPEITSSLFSNAFQPTVARFPSKTIPVAFPEIKFS